MNRLDEVGFGGITPSSFDRFVGTRLIWEAVEQLRAPPAGTLTIPLWWMVYSFANKQRTL